MKNITKISTILGLVIILLHCISCLPEKNKDPLIRISVKDKNNKNLVGAWYKIDTFEKVYFGTKKKSSIIPATGLPITFGADNRKDVVTIETCGIGLRVDTYEVILNDNVSSNNCLSTQQKLNGTAKLRGLFSGTLEYLKYTQTLSNWATLSFFQPSYTGCFPVQQDSFSDIDFKKGNNKTLRMKIKKTTTNSDTKVNVVLVEDSSMITLNCEGVNPVPIINPN